MAKKLVDYEFNSLNVTNPDGSLPMNLQGGSVTSGPGATAAGTFPKAVNLGNTGHGSVNLASVGLDYKRFTVRVVFQANGRISRRQNLVETNRLPFALFLVPRKRSTEFDLVGSVGTKAHGWRAATTEFSTSLKANTWYTADLVYDRDTVGVFLNGQIVSLRAFPNGVINKLSGKTLFVGTWTDGARDHFNGKIAALQLYDGIPQELESQLDERRTYPEWFITYKEESIRGKINMGSPKTKIQYDTNSGAYIQHFDHGALMFEDGIGAAFEIHGAIYSAYKRLNDKKALGYLVSDETKTQKQGGRKSVFSKGTIYWSGGTGAFPVTGQMYLDYEALGATKALGFPKKSPKTISGGIEQEFQSANMYYRNGDTNAHEVHGAILTRYKQLGGPHIWGYPITNETDVRKDKNTVLGKFSEFEGCTIYWSQQTGAFEVHGDIRRKYNDLKGPLGDLGFPTSNEMDIPGYSGPGRFNTFHKGSILWYGSWSSIIVARPFKVHIGRINTDESEGFMMGQNDLYIKLTLKVGSQTVYNKKHPDGEWGGRNIVDVNYDIPSVITPNSTKTATLTVDVWESDSGSPFGGGDDHLGKWVKHLNPANAWGMRENTGILDSGSFSKINSINASIKPQVDIKSLTETEKFWGVQNRGTDDLTYQQYCERVFGCRLGYRMVGHYGLAGKSLL